MNELKSTRTKNIDKTGDTSRPVATGVGAVLGGTAGGVAGGAAAGAAGLQWRRDRDALVVLAERLAQYASKAPAAPVVNAPNPSS